MTMNDGPVDPNDGKKTRIISTNYLSASMQPPSGVIQRLKNHSLTIKEKPLEVSK